METKANYVLIGLFALSVVAAAFGFVFWFHNIGGTAKRSTYLVRFDGSAAGLQAGSAVLFNGIRMGEVMKIFINPDDPHQVIATIGVDQRAPIRTDTAVGLDFQGLTGVASIALTGGSKDAPLFAPTFGGEPPMLIADASGTQDVTRAARDVLRRIDDLLVEGGSLNNTFKNIEMFSASLANNTKHIDSILAGLDNLAGGDSDIQEAARSLKTLAENLDKRTDGITAGINKLTAVGAKELETTGYTARRTLGEIEKAVKNFDANPSRIIFGGSGSSTPTATRPAAPAR